MRGVVAVSGALAIAAGVKITSELVLTWKFATVVPAAGFADGATQFVASNGHVIISDLSATTASSRPTMRVFWFELAAVRRWSMLMFWLFTVWCCVAVHVTYGALSFQMAAFAWNVIVPPSGISERGVKVNVIAAGARPSRPSASATVRKESGDVSVVVNPGWVVICAVDFDDAALKVTVVALDGLGMSAPVQVITVVPAATSPLPAVIVRVV
jgi:hypothetical protein